MHPEVPDGFELYGSYTGRGGSLHIDLTDVEIATCADECRSRYAALRSQFGLAFAKNHFFDTL